MSLAIRAITRLQDADDLNVSLGAGVDEYALSWDNDTAKFVLRAVSGGASDHGALTGLSDDDHSQYLLATGARTGASSQAQTFTFGVAGPSIRPLADAADAIQIKDVAGNRALAFSTTNYQIPRIYGDTATPYFELSTAIGTTIAYGANCTLYLGGPIWYTTGGVPRMGIESDGYFWIGTRRLDAAVVITHLLSVTNSVVDNFLISGRTSGTPAAGYGTAIVLQLDSSTTDDQSAARIKTLWYEATHASRKADLVFSAYDTAEREGLRIRGAGSEPAIGFYGVAPITRAILATGAGATVDNVITALQNLGLVKQS